MRKFRSRIGLVGAVVLAGALLWTPTTPAEAQIYPGSELEARKKNDQAAARYRQYVFGKIAEVLDKWKVAWREDDAAELSRHYAASSAVLLPGKGRLLRGRSTLQTRLEEFLPGVEEILISPTDLEASGQMGVIVGRYRIYGRAGSTGGPDQGTFMTAFRRIDGDWKIRSQIFRPDTKDSTGG